MKIICIYSRKPGLYLRRQVIYKGDWVNIRGFAFLLTRHKRRKWAGWAIVFLKNRLTHCLRVIKNTAKS